MLNSVVIRANKQFHTYYFRRCRNRLGPNDISESTVRFVSLYDKPPMWQSMGTGEEEEEEEEDFMKKEINSCCWNYNLIFYRVIAILK